MMTFIRWCAFALAALPLVASPTFAQTGSGTSAGDVYARMQKINANLKSYTAQLKVDVTTHSFPYLSPSLEGTAYFKRPDKNAVVFNTVPVLASQFKKVYPQMEPPSEWPRIYDVTPVSDDGATSQFKLVRKKNGRIDHVDVKVDDKTATVIGMAYFYKDGGTVTFSQIYDQIEGNYVLRAQTGKVDLPHYNADVSSTFSNYKLNVNVPDKVFQQ